MKQILLSIGDGPDGVDIFTDEDQAIVNHCSPDSVFVRVSIMGATATFGPMLPDVGRQLRDKLK